MHEDALVGQGNLKIHFRSWRPNAAPTAIVVINHGLNSHGGQYVWPSEQLSATGYAVYAIDMRGRGKSEGPRYYVGDIADYADDLGSLIEVVTKHVAADMLDFPLRQVHPAARIGIPSDRGSRADACFGLPEPPPPDSQLVD